MIRHHMPRDPRIIDMTGPKRAWSFDEAKGVIEACDAAIEAVGAELTAKHQDVVALVIETHGGKLQPILVPIPYHK